MLWAGFALGFSFAVHNERGDDDCRGDPCDPGRVCLDVGDDEGGDGGDGCAKHGAEVSADALFAFDGASCKFPQVLDGGDSANRPEDDQHRCKAAALHQKPAACAYHYGGGCDHHPGAGFIPQGGFALPVEGKAPSVEGEVVAKYGNHKQKQVGLQDGEGDGGHKNDGHGPAKYPAAVEVKLMAVGHKFGVNGYKAAARRQKSGDNVEGKDGGIHLSFEFRVQGSKF